MTFAKRASIIMVLLMACNAVAAPRAPRQSGPPPEAYAACEGKQVGDVEFQGAREQAGWITPVPGGVGPMTITMLMFNTLRAARLSAGLDS